MKTSELDSQETKNRGKAENNNDDIHTKETCETGPKVEGTDETGKVVEEVTKMMGTE
ncbi:hypothetical protein [Negadavirga shengliensis]|uniref:Uncharacterized protein n=1 Tax=Negadavirga shengliensis TaxID=1389218 RepID=A0ABV9SXP9_9BACT